MDNWYNVLSNINGVSKMLDSEDMTIDAAINQLKTLNIFLEHKKKQDLN